MLAFDCITHNISKVTKQICLVPFSIEVSPVQRPILINTGNTVNSINAGFILSLLSPEVVDKLSGTIF